MIVPYNRFYENKSRRYVEGKRYRLGNPRHPQYAYYKFHGMKETLKYMNITEVSHSPSRMGDISEHYAITWLWDRGYEVFKNCGCSGMADMIAWDQDKREVIFIDVKTRKIERGRGIGRSSEQIKHKVKLLQVDPDTRSLKFVEHKHD